MRTKRALQMQALLPVQLGALLILATPLRLACQSLAVHADFNGDGFVDLAIGVPQEGVGSVRDAGAVNVLYGSAAGLTATGNQFWTQNSPGVLDTAETGDFFGSRLAPGDFNGDGFADLAIGVPGEDVGSTVDAGAVNVLYGSAAGLTATGNQFWTQNSSGILDTAEAGDRFGYLLAVGDFNGDGFADLAIGVPGEDVGSTVDAGAVNVLYGSAAGLTATGNQFWTQNSPGVLDTAETDDYFGSRLAAADFNGDGFADLAIGVYQEGVGTASESGAVNVLYGSAAGLTATGNQFWSQDSPGILDTAESSDWFGVALAAGDFNDDGFADLAIGAYQEGVGTARESGAVNVLYGSAAGLTATGNQFWSQDSPGILDTAEGEDYFGNALAAGDLNGDGFADLTIGVPYEDVGSVSNAGAVNVLYGSAAGLTATGNQFWTQDSPGVLDTAEAGDRFGYTLAAGDFNGDGFADLAIGVPYEDVGSVSNAGAVNVLYGSAAGLTATGNQFWTQDSPSVLDTAETSDIFGMGLSK